MLDSECEQSGGFFFLFALTFTQRKLASKSAPNIGEKFDTCLRKPLLANAASVQAGLVTMARMDMVQSLCKTGFGIAAKTYLFF